MSKLKLILIVSLIFGYFSSCKNQSPIPQVYVNFLIQLNDPTFLPLSPVGGSVYIPHEGNKGIIVIQSGYQEFSAYDATCTHDPENEWGRVQIEDNGIFAIDTLCGSQFSLVMGGVVTHGPAGLGLVQYAIDYNANMQTLRIHN
ncbi:MAG: hypothetical protein B6I20_08245 [Bacteroidetes bacterium 4572_117]|nr:MAG: hypothetical protein B6I20_08245 [Bacteroidetes bacterium 4572_117]